MTKRTGWTRQQLMVAFGLYCQIPFGKMHSRNPEVIKFAALIGRTPSALAMKLTNIASLDPAITSTGRKGLPGASALDRDLWDEMQSDWIRFANEFDNAITSLSSDVELFPASPLEEYGMSAEPLDFSGKDKLAQTKVRIGQAFFRKSVLSAYNYRCCISGLSIPGLLVASHIVPWSDDPTIRLNPRNGLALSMLHDKAFDLGMITVNENLTVRVSQKMAPVDDGFFVSSIQCYEGAAIALPEKFLPDTEFLAYHRENIFQA